MDPVTALVIALGAFLLGSFPTGYLVARSRGVDIRRHGSGNIGATNVFRTIGKPLGVFVFAIDAIKGFAAVWFSMQCAPPAGEAVTWAGIMSAVMVIVGHNYTPWLGFRGGKGIATSAGVLLALMPWAIFCITVVWFVVFWLSRYVSLASISASAALPVSVAGLWLAGVSGNAPLLGFALLISALAIWRHRSNIERLRQGVEPRFARKTKA